MPRLRVSSQVSCRGAAAFATRLWASYTLVMGERRPRTSGQQVYVAHRTMRWHRPMADVCLQRRVALNLPVAPCLEVSTTAGPCRATACDTPGLGRHDHFDRYTLHAAGSCRYWSVRRYQPVSARVRHQKRAVLTPRRSQHLPAPKHAPHIGFDHQLSTFKSVPYLCTTLWSPQSQRPSRRRLRPSVSR